MFFIFSGDILVLYSICGLLLIPLTFLETGRLWVISILFFAARIFISWPEIPVDASSAELIQGSYRHYGEGSFFAALSFRRFEIRHLIALLLLSVWPRTMGVMVLGFISWKLKWMARLQQGSTGKYFGYFFFVFGMICTGVDAYIAWNGLNMGRWNILIGDLGVLGLAFGYSIFVLRLPPTSKFVRWLAPLGRLGLTTYLTQTILLGLIFYGYGLGLFGQLGSFSASCLAVGFYGIQILASKAYLTRFKQGLLEYAWRKITYLGHK